MANVYDAVTRAEAIRQCNFCDPRSAEIISRLVRWLDEADAATSQRKYNDLLLSYGTAVAERDRLHAAINTPELVDFGKAVHIEAVHQRERWGSEHDAGKEPQDWFWLIGYVAGKALHAAITGNIEKLLHHIITTAAVCNNWHAQALGKSNMRPGLPAEKQNA